MRPPFTPQFFRRLQSLKVRTRRAFLGTRQGLHISVRKGHGLEFADFRSYVPGDDFRHIDWGVYGRTDRLYVRQFQDEQDLHVMMLVDASSSMFYPEGEGKFDLARDLALALGYVAMTDGDTVTFGILGGEKSPRYVGARAISRAIRLLDGVKARGQFSMLDAVRKAVASQRLPAQSYFFSDFLFPFEEQIKCLELLRGRNFEVVVFQVLAPSELELDLSLSTAVLEDAETGEELQVALDSSLKREYALLLADHVGRLENYCAKSGIPHILIKSTDRVEDVVLTRLPELGLLK